MSRVVLILIAAALLLGAVLVVLLSIDTGAPLSATNPAQPKSVIDDQGYSTVRLFWVTHGPPHEVTTEPPLMEALGIAHGTQEIEAPQLYRIIEGEVLGIGRGHWPRFRYLPFLTNHRRQVLDELRKKYPQLVQIDESNGATGELHVARLRDNLWVAWFGSWYNPWSIVVASAAERSHTDAAIAEWAEVSEMLSGHFVDRSWLLDGARNGEAAQDSNSVSYAVSSWDRDSIGLNMLVFIATSNLAPPKPYKGDTP